MNLERHIKEMEETIPILQATMRNVGAEEARWKPAADRWSMLEVVNHMADEETEDFRACLTLLLTDPAQDWPKLKSWDWVEERSYNGRELAASVERFVAARRASTRWLDELTDPEWSNLHTGQRPFERALTAGDVLIGWVAHDYFHLNQLTALKWEYMEEHENGYSTIYAGPIYWRPESYISPAD